MLNWLKKNVESATGKLGLTEISRLRTMREDASHRSGRNRDLVAQGRSPAFMICSRESRNRALGYWFLRGAAYTPEFALEPSVPNNEFGCDRFSSW